VIRTLSSEDERMLVLAVALWPTRLPLPADAGERMLDALGAPFGRCAYAACGEPLSEPPRRVAAGVLTRSFLRDDC
jgi:hypothetical protein